MCHIASYILPRSPFHCNVFHLLHTGVDNGGRGLICDLPGAAAGGLNGFDNLQRCVVRNLAEDDMLAVEPAGDDSRDEEL